MKNITFAPEDLELLGAEVLRESGAMSFEVTDEKSEPITAEYLVVWQKRGGEWKISAMSWSRIIKNQGAGGQ